MTHRVSGAAITATLLLGISAASAQQAGNAAIDRHVEVATAAAKTDLTGALGLCKTATPEPAASFMDNYKEMQKRPPLEPMQVMDELYFLGNYWTSAWAVKTSQGIVIIDALDNAEEAKQYIEQGLRKLKLDPADIKYVIVSHAHGDHYGGAAYLKEKFNPRIVMSEIDWATFDDPKFDPKRIPLFDPPPKRDMAVKDGDSITLGSTTFKLHVIPGHTLGTLATVFTVHDHGQEHHAVAWGGTAYNFGPLPDRLQIYSDTTVKYRDVLKQEHADVLLSNHVSFDSAVAKMAALNERKPSEANPFVVGEDTVQRFLTVLGECALATKAYVEAGQPGKEQAGKK
ncbi:MBL fold metallo-hydrolase [Bradyrhizobium tropiciagri]|uniref:MBL fold metallo-hydrolase n=1 Tax=Bradyrhizobium tropiciagri TaxID=312253 RepID=UPI001BA4E41F|nr:MBL fold metallo-hydrolase [Bradyrhizobium tropiciagri]MBR0873629.1 MBL fold metallo-hydrolase [Bradyrhizobium tropiciagri]